MFRPDFEKFHGLVPVVAQDWQSGEVLTLAFMNEEAWRRTVETGKAHYWSRSRNKLWLKGETSGHFQLVKEVLVDCDDDALVIKVEQVGGAACHTGHRSCFYRALLPDGVTVVKGKRIFDPGDVYR